MRCIWLSSLAAILFLPMVCPAQGAGTALAAPVEADPQAIQQLKPWPSASNLRFGGALAVSPDTLAVGAVGASKSVGEVYLFRRQGSRWVPHQKLSYADDVNDVTDQFGTSVAISGDTLAVGAETAAFCKDIPRNVVEHLGAVHLFVRHSIGGLWTYQQTLCADSNHDIYKYGHSIALLGDTLIVGAPSAPPGRAWIYRRNHANASNQQWTLEAVLDPAKDYGRAFGYSVALWGDTALVGDPLDKEGGHDPGAVTVFVHRNGVWTRQQKLLVSEGDAEFGASVAMAHDLAVAGAPRRGKGARGFVRGAVPWLGVDIQAHDIEPGSGFGGSVALSGSLLAVTAETAGAAFLFAHRGPTWQELAKITPADGAPGEAFGSSVAALGPTVFVGARNADDFAGAVYVFQVDFAQADLAVESRGGTAPLRIGDTITFTASTRNHGPGGASNVVLAAELGAGLRLISATPGQGTCDSGSTLCRLGDLGPGDSASVTYQARAALPGTWSSHFHATADEVDSEPSNDAAVSTVRVKDPLVLELAPPRQIILAGETASFRGTLLNQSRVDLTDVVVSVDKIPGCSLSRPVLPAAGRLRWRCALPGVLADVTASARVIARLPDGSAVETLTTVAVDVDSDTDGDGVPDGVEDLASLTGDGNQDGFRDATQAAVTSLPTEDGQLNVTLVTGNGCSQNQKVRMLDPWALAGERFHPAGIVSFELPCETATVEITFHGKTLWESPLWDSYGPLPYPGQSVWYITFPPFASVAGETWTLTLADAASGDQTGDDGRIVIQGGPTSPAPVPTLSSTSLALLAVILLAAGLIALRRVSPAALGPK